jgi:hypothetical protein
LPERDREKEMLLSFSYSPTYNRFEIEKHKVMLWPEATSMALCCIETKRLTTTKVCWNTKYKIFHSNSPGCDNQRGGFLAPTYCEGFLHGRQKMS